MAPFEQLNLVRKRPNGVSSKGAQIHKMVWEMMKFNEKLCDFLKFNDRDELSGPSVGQMGWDARYLVATQIKIIFRKRCVFIKWDVTLKICKHNPKRTF